MKRLMMEVNPTSQSYTDFTKLKSTRFYMKKGFVLRGLDFDVICYCSGLPEKNREQLNSESFQVLANPVDLSKLLPTADLVINHASKEMVGEALLAGVPQLVLPSQLEQIETSHLIEALGVGLKLSTVASKKEVLSALHKLIGDKKYRKAAEKNFCCAYCYKAIM